MATTLSKLALLKQGTTPMLEAIVDGAAIQDATVYLTIKTRCNDIVKSNYNQTGDMILLPVYDDNDEQIGTSITVIFSQEETLLMTPGSASVEAGWIFEDGTADKSDLGTVNISSTLFKGVMKYGNYSS